MGTPREKAELLVWLYQQAGLQASVVAGYLAVSGDAASTVYGRTLQRSFEPTVDQSTLDGWSAQLSGSTSPSPIDPSDMERQAIVQSLQPLLPPGASASLDGTPPTPSSLALGEVPLVGVMVGGQVTYANPLLPSAAFGQPYTDEATPGLAPPAGPALPVAVEVFVSRTAQPAQRLSVARASFTADQVVGRQVALQFIPTVGSYDALAGLQVKDLHVFRPALALRGVDVDDATFAGSLAIGSDVTLEGDVVTTGPDGTVKLNGQPVVGPGAGTDASKVSSVASLQVVTVNASGFPSVSLHVRAADAGGQAVTGLPASAFGVAEGGVPQGFAETGSPMQPPSLALIVDVDGPLQSGEEALDLAQQLTSLVAAAGGDVTVISGGLASGPFTDPAAVVSAFGEADDDAGWMDVAAAAVAGAPLTVLVSDFVGFVGADGAPYRSTVSAGPPVIAVGVPDPSGQVTVPPDVTALVAATGGQSLPGAGIGSALAAVQGFLNARAQAGAYTLSYSAPASGASNRTVTVKTSDGRLSASGTYVAPGVATGDLPSALCGIHLAVTVGTRTVTRTLAGYPGTQPPGPQEPLTPSMLDEVHGAMFGATILSFEGGAPTLSAWLDDLLTAKLAMRPLWDAVQAADVSAIRAALGVTRYYLPPELALLQCPLDIPGTGAGGGSATLTYPSGLRVVALTEHLSLGVGRIRTLDVLGFPGWLTFAADAQTSFGTTLARSARAAVVENHVFDSGAVSAAGLLAGTTLQFLDAVSVFGDQLTTIPAAERQAAADTLNLYQDFYKLVPAQGPLTAFWAIHSGTGTVLAVLPDGTGGASHTAACADLDVASGALDVLGLMGDLGPFGVYGVLGKAVAAIFVATAIILDGASDPSFTYDPDALMKGIAGAAACNALSDNTVGKIGEVSPTLGNVNAANAFTGILGAAHLDTCPNGLAALGCGG